MESLLWACDILAMVILVTWSARRETGQTKGSHIDHPK